MLMVLPSVQFVFFLTSCAHIYIYIYLKTNFFIGSIFEISL
jgi:hypothetical protein